ncbi:MAG: hypothetical protein HUJ58_09840, partial [Erysipelotrichaceae bacterium]|nr:hypothetical protein [Erysipelotrichaceae bacterium]
VIEGKMISIDYEGDGQTATIRKSNEIGDISGDYNDYGKEETNTTESGIEYTYKVRTTIWMNDDYSYSATFNYDVTTDEVIALMKTLK